MIDNNKLVECTTLSVYCKKATVEEQITYGVNAWGFDFYVRKEEAYDLMIHVVKRFAEFHLPMLNIRLGKNLFINEHDVWTKQAIDTCLDANREFLEDSRVNSDNLTL